MKTLPEVLHFWKSLVSSVRNCNTSTAHRLAAAAPGPVASRRRPARPAPHTQPRGGGRAWRTPGSHPASSRHGRHEDTSRGRRPTEVASAGPRSPGRAARRAAPPARSPAAPSPRSAPRRAAGPEAPRSFAHARAQERMRGARRSRARTTPPSRLRSDRAGPASRAGGAGPATTAPRGPAPPRGAPRQPRAAAATPRHGPRGGATGGARAARVSASSRGAAGAGRANGRPWGERCGLGQRRAAAPGSAWCRASPCSSRRKAVCCPPHGRRCGGHSLQTDRKEMRGRLLAPAAGADPRSRQCRGEGRRASSRGRPRGVVTQCIK